MSNTAVARAAKIPTAAEIAGRAGELTPVLRGRAREAETLRRLPDATIRDIDDAGLIRVLIPRRYGGFELDLNCALDTMSSTGRGCASTAWVLSIYQQHAWIVAHFPQQAQDECLGSLTNPHIAAILQPRGKARVVDGGFVLDGFWPFASGSPHAEWILFGALVVGDDGEEIVIDRMVNGVAARNARLFLVPRDDIEILDDWNAAGLAGTGSHSTRVDGAFVPEYRSLSIADALDGIAPGRALHDGPLFRTPYYSVLNAALGGLAPGVARAALDGFLGRIDKHLVPPMNLIQSNLIRAHRQVADATAKIEVSEMLLKDLGDRIMAVGRDGTSFGALDKARVRLNTALAVRYAYEAIERIFMAAGGAALSLDNPVQRAMRDIHGVSAHQFLDVETALELKGMVELDKVPFTYLF